MGRCIRRLLVLSSVVAVLLVAGIAHADDSMLDALPKIQSGEAHEHVRTGNAFYRTGQFEQALREYQLALQLEPVADVIVYNIAQCDRMLGRWQEEIWTYRRFLNHAVIGSVHVQRIEQYIKDAERKLAAQREAEKQAAAGETNRPHTDSPPKPADGARSADTAVPSTITPPSSVPSRPTRLVHGEPWYRDPIAWSVTGVGLVGVGIGTGLLVNGSHLDNEANAMAGEEQRDALHARAGARRIDGAIAGGLGAAATIAGIVMLIVHPVDHEEPIATWHLTVTGHGVALGGSF